ncbi:unnamed protein product, partial [Polarella glacialis]
AEVAVTSSGPISQDALDRCTAFVVGSAAGPVMASMMAGYVELPITCLTALRKDEELLHLRVNLLFGSFSSAGSGGERVLSIEDFSEGYLSFFDRAPGLLREAPDSEQPDTSSPCSVQ